MSVHFTHDSCDGVHEDPFEDPFYAIGNCKVPQVPRVEGSVNAFTKIFQILSNKPSSKSSEPSSKSSKKPSNKSFNKVSERISSFLSERGCGVPYLCLGLLSSGIAGFCLAKAQLVTAAFPIQKGDHAWFLLGFVIALGFALGFKRLARLDRSSALEGLMREKRRADVIAASILDGIILLRGDEILYLNPVGAKILGLPSDHGIRGMRLRRSTSGLNTEGLTAVKEAMGRALPVEFSLLRDGRRSTYFIQTIHLTDDFIRSIELSSIPDYARVLDRFSADTLVLAHDVTLIREGQEAKGHFLATFSH